jgi:nucleotide-binding universal stress UspA family protein
VAGVRRVIAGVSGSPGNLQALRYAADLARAHEATLVPVHAWMPPGGELADRRQPSGYLRTLWRDAAASRLLDALGLAFGGLPGDVRCEPRVVRGETAAALVHVADSDGDVLVVGAGRRGQLRRLLACRVARYCAAHARCPVVAVPPPDLATLGHGLRGWRSRQHELDRAVADGS